jgi:hypothetical protein
MGSETKWKEYVMNKTFSAACAFALAFSAAACAPLQGANPAAGLDLVPPVLKKACAAGPDRLVLEFDEEPVLKADSLEIEPSLAVTGHEVKGTTIEIHTAPTQVIGEEYRLRATVEDASGNAAWLIARFYGYNPAPPRLVINEFITQGSATHPDLVELKVLDGGNMGGVTFYSGTPARWKQRFVFPAASVRRGDFILLHLKPQGLTAEIDETSSPAVSGGLDASAAAWDFWLKDGTGLSGNNGAISLCERPDGPLLDAVLYSTRASDSDSTYRGFGSFELREQADELFEAGGWLAAGEKIAPEDAVNPEGSTATRSICRSSDSADTNGKGDFHVVPTRQSSFGRDNSDEIYVP